MSTRGQDETPKLGHLAGVLLEGLFGDRRIEFDTPLEGPTLLYGRNGTGKSTVLRLIDDIAHVRWAKVLTQPFERITLSFRTSDNLSDSRETGQLAVRLADKTWIATSEQIRDASKRSELRRRRAIETGHLVPRRLQSRLFDLRDLDEPSRWMLTIPELFPVFFIEEQRLIAKRPDQWRPRPDEPGDPEAAVSAFTRELRNEIQQALGFYASRSQELDRRFPGRVAQAVEAEQDAASPEELRQLLNEVEQERRILHQVGLLGSEEGPIPFDPGRLETARLRPVIQTFAEDTLRKFEVLRELRGRLELFQRFLNQHYQGKSVRTSREAGFQIELDDGQPLRPDQLSSGEQQILALAFRILFRSDPGTLILIDEPELSLHVLWQSTLIEDLAAMGRARDVTFLLATHSPTLISDRRDLMRSLDDPGVSRVDKRTGQDEDAELFDELEEGLDELEELEALDLSELEDGHDDATG
jgi:ABC-type transport system involved in cytochrome c biogenesis ATPase subunit